MLHKPCFKPHFKIRSVPEENAVFLVSESENFVLQGRLYALLLPWLDGRHGADQIVDALAGEASAAEIYYALSQLEKKGYLTEATALFSPEQAAFWSALGIDAETAYNAFSQLSVAFVPLEAADASVLQSAWEELSVPVTPEARVTMVLTGDYLHPELAELNRRFIKENKTWVLAKLTGTEAWLGPLFAPGETGCWECLAQRIRSNNMVEDYLAQKKAGWAANSGRPPALPSTISAAANMLVTELLKHFLTGRSRLSGGQMLSFDMREPRTDGHYLTKRPQCPVCGEPEDITVQPSPPVFHSAPKVFTRDGGHRAILPEKTLQKYARQVSPITGVVSRLINITEDDPFLKVYHSGHNHAVHYHNLNHMRRGLRSQSAGKGMSDAASKAGALCEAVERYSGVYRGEEKRIRASFRELGDKAIHPNRIMNFSPDQYLNRDATNPRSGGFNQVPEPFDEDQVIDWTAVWSLTRENFFYLPAGFCYYSHPEYKGVFVCSNGSASGNVPEEAILQGFFELAERDGVALWWYNRLSRPGVDLESFNEPYIQEMRDYYTGRGREIWALDLTSDLNIPVFAAFSRRINRDTENIVFGFGAHFEPRVALTRALTELNQCMPLVLEWEKNPEPGTKIDSEILKWYTDATVKNQPYLLPDAGRELRRAENYTDLSSNDFLEDIKTCRRIVENLGMEMLFLDMTRPDIGMPVVKVIVPGLRHFWRRLAPGRLYDVPVKMGWLKAPQREEEMNPINIFF